MTFENSLHSLVDFAACKDDNNYIWIIGGKNAWQENHKITRLDFRENNYRNWEENWTSDIEWGAADVQSLSNQHKNSPGY